ncbi:MAG: hypothetical protein R6U96_03820 [Promethearchaeia archaeon]
MALQNTLNTIIMFIAGTALIIGNYYANLLAKILGLIIGGLSFTLAVYSTLKLEEGATIDDLILSNSFNATLFIGMLFTIGFFFEGNDVGLQIFFDIGTITGLFLIFMILWTYLREYWSFLEGKRIRFEEESDKEEIPQFLLSSVILGAIFAGLFTIFELIYLFAGYLITVVIFLIIFFGISIFMSLLFRYVMKYQNNQSKSERNKK